MKILSLFMPHFLLNFNYFYSVQKKHICNGSWAKKESWMLLIQQISNSINNSSCDSSPVKLNGALIYSQVQFKVYII